MDKTNNSTILINAAKELVEAHAVHIPDTRKNVTDGKVWHYTPTVGKSQSDGAVSFGIVCNAVLCEKAALELLKNFRLDVIKTIDKAVWRDRRKGKVVFNRMGYWHMGRFCTSGWIFTFEQKAAA